MEQAKLERKEKTYFKDKTKPDPKRTTFFRNLPLEINVLNAHMPLTKQNSNHKIKQKQWLQGGEEGKEEGGREEIHQIKRKYTV